MQFGQSAEEYQQSRGDEGEVWIRRFKDPSTRIRIVPFTRVINGQEKSGTKAWPTEREHYHQQIGYFPHYRFGDAKCVGCEDPDKKVQDMSRKYYFPALDEKGSLRIFKMGGKLFEIMQGREQRLGTLSDRDYIINKMGKNLGTTYDPEPGEKYDVDMPDQSEIPDIGAVLTDLYKKALAYYESEGTEQPEEPEVGPQDDVTPRDSEVSQRIQRPAEAGGRIQREPAAASNGHKETPPTETIDVEVWGLNPDEDVFDSNETGAVKKWLDWREVEYPSRAPRARILELAKTKAAEAPY